MNRVVDKLKLARQVGESSTAERERGREKHGLIFNYYYYYFLFQVKVID